METGQNETADRCLMLGTVEPVEILKCIGAILGYVIVLMLVPGIIVSAWSGMSLWQRLALAVIGLVIWQLLRPRRHLRN